MLMQRRKLTLTPLIICGICLASGSANAQGPATVSVRVELVAQCYRERFPDRGKVEAQAAVLFADYLRRNVGCLRLVVGDTALPCRLPFLLERLDRNTATKHDEIGFWVR